MSGSLLQACFYLLRSPEHSFGSFMMRPELVERCPNTVSIDMAAIFPALIHSFQDVPSILKRDGIPCPCPSTLDGVGPRGIVPILNMAQGEKKLW